MKLEERWIALGLFTIWIRVSFYFAAGAAAAAGAVSFAAAGAAPSAGAAVAGAAVAGAAASGGNWSSFFIPPIAARSFSAVCAIAEPG